MPNKFYKMTAKSTDEADISIYGEIGDSIWGGETVSASNFKKDLDALGNVSVLNININSPGGSVFDGLAIYNMLARHAAKKIVTIDGLAASAASFIAMAGDIIIMPKNAFMMIHRASTWAWGNTDDLAKAIELLQSIDKNLVDIYAKRCKKPKKKVKEMLDAETWMDGTEAVEMGFADKLENEKKVAACVGDFFMSKYRNIPQNLIPHTDPDHEPEPEPELEDGDTPEETAADGLMDIYKAKIKNNLRRSIA
jgi:ATP-dependent Clp protease protease subunit